MIPIVNAEISSALNNTVSLFQIEYNGMEQDSCILFSYYESRAMLIFHIINDNWEVELDRETIN